MGAFGAGELLFRPALQVIDGGLWRLRAADHVAVAADEQAWAVAGRDSAQGARRRVHRDVHALRQWPRDSERHGVGALGHDLGEVEATIQYGDPGGEDEATRLERSPTGGHDGRIPCAS